MCYYNVVITCGISFFGKRNAYGACVEECSALTREGLTVCPSPHQSDEAATDAWNALSKVIRLNKHQKNARNISAEYSGLAALSKSKQLKPNPRITLIHTNTFDGKLAAQTLKRIIATDFDAQVTLSGVDDLDVSNRVKLHRGLGNFMTAVAKALRMGEPSSTCFIPIGGYKVMTSHGSIAGSWLGYSTGYIHERDSTLHHIPAIPFRLEPHVLKAIAPCLLTISNGSELSSLSQADREVVKTHAWLFEQDEDMIAVNGLGQFIMALDENAHLFKTQVFLSNEAIDRLSGEHSRSFAYHQIADLIRLLDADGHNQGRLRHEWFAVDGGWHLFKGVSNGERIFRALYRQRGNTIEIGQVWFKHVTQHRYEDPQPDAVFNALDSFAWTDVSSDFYAAR